MDLKFSVAGRIARPVGGVFEAIVDPQKLSKFFSTGGAQGRIEPGATVSWDFHDFPGAFPVKVVEIVTNEKIVLEWGADAGDDPQGPYDTKVTMEFSALEDGRTLVKISEEGWRENVPGLKASYGNCQGWTHMLCALKVYIEHGINLRDGFFR